MTPRVHAIEALLSQVRMRWRLLMALRAVAVASGAAALVLALALMAHLAFEPRGFVLVSIWALALAGAMACLLAIVPRIRRVPGNQQWTAANFMVRDGDRIQFSGSGEIQLSVDPEDRASVAGSLKGRRAPGSPAPQYLAGALIGRIGGGAPFAIGDQTAALPMSGNGPLWLGVNDDQVGDNSGEFVVTVRLIRRGR